MNKSIFIYEEQRITRRTEAFAIKQNIAILNSVKTTLTAVQSKHLTFFLTLFSCIRCTGLKGALPIFENIRGLQMHLIVRKI